MPRLFVDTAVLAYAVGGAHEQREPCRQILAAAGRGEIELHASVEAVQEFLFHRMRRSDRESAVQQAQDVMSLVVLHDFDRDVLAGAVRLVGSGALAGRDAVHAASAAVAGFSAIVTPDRDFDGLVDLVRVDPADAVAG
ncbi:PIN domain-containing protein [Cellulomonas rhizosphaerae]|uniref:Ribonuclease VapC n=1 Tax=Cellulomonas rhizosphaerae TaxID=2293719 RepID=A0A413RMQ1_9CELL|nr:PIN domain-containing protein [Cellulomonas rhizosphaerae]